MRTVMIGEREAGQRLDKFLGKYMAKAPKGFFYKMFRKKNIVLNGKKPEGGEKLSSGDEIRLFLSEETIEKFSAGEESRKKVEKPTSERGVSDRSKRALPPLEVLYEDEDVLFLNKPQGLLSQRARSDDISVVELLTEYCLKTGRMKEEDLRLFHPAVCNRLDRNTSGIVIAGLSVKGLQAMSELLRGRSVGKYYRCIVAGRMDGACRLEGYLEKEEASNQVRIWKEPREQASPIVTKYRPLKTNGRLTYLEVKLITGKSHQIRAHLASVGHPVIGDWKYGDERQNRMYRDRYRIKSQLLHSYRLELPEDLPALPKLEGKVVTAPLPAVFSRTLVKEGLSEEPEWERGIRGDFGDQPWRSL